MTPNNSDANKRRYEEILRRIAAKQVETAEKPAQDALIMVLDALDAMGFLDELKQRPPTGIHCWGPKVFTSRPLNPNNPDALAKHQRWRAAAIWHKPHGYGQYQTLGVLGIWGIESGEAVEIVIGTKTLEYNAPLFNAESYQLQMKKGFHAYYDGDAAPPIADADQAENSAAILYQQVYDPAQRLATRNAIEGVLSQWKQQTARRSS